MEQKNHVNDPNNYDDEVVMVQMNNHLSGAHSLPGLTGEGVTCQGWEQVYSMADQEVVQEEKKSPIEEHVVVVGQPSTSDIPSGIGRSVVPEKRKREEEDDEQDDKTILMNRHQAEAKENVSKPRLRKVLVAGRGRGKPKKGNCVSLSRIDNFLVRKPLMVGGQQNKFNEEQVDHMEKGKLATKRARVE